MLGIIPAAGIGSRLQPLAFSKELLPVGSRDDDGVERPVAVSEYLLERLLLAGVTRLCFVISANKCDIVRYYGSSLSGVPIGYAVQDEARGLCDAVFQARAFAHPGERVLVGLPDTIWFPKVGLRSLPRDVLSFLLFPVAEPSYFDAVVTDEAGAVKEIQVKAPAPASSWIWGAFSAPGYVFAALFELWQHRGGREPYFGTLINAYLEEGGKALGIKAGTSYVDVGTPRGYREALTLLGRGGAAEGSARSWEGVADASLR